MKFEKFTILVSKDTLGQMLEEVDVVFNIAHIISVKPIRISRPDKLVNGFWIRTTNGKKYRATKVPDQIAQAFGRDFQPGGIEVSADPDEQPFQ